MIETNIAIRLERVTNKKLSAAIHTLFSLTISARLQNWEYKMVHEKEREEDVTETTGYGNWIKLFMESKIGIPLRERKKKYLTMKKTSMRNEFKVSQFFLFTQKRLISECKKKNSICLIANYIFKEPVRPS